MAMSPCSCMVEAKLLLLRAMVGSMGIFGDHGESDGLWGEKHLGRGKEQVQRR
jgi:hypothetical protein